MSDFDDMDDRELAGLEPLAAPNKRRGAGDKPKVDWYAIEQEWLAGLRPVTHIAQQYGVSHTAINKHFAALGMKRDLKPQIMAKAEALVSAALVSQKVSAETNLSDKALIEAGAVDVARVLVGQRKTIQRHAEIACRLLDELEVTTGNKELFDQLGEILRAPDDKGMDKLNDIYQKVMALPGRVDSFKKLTDSVKILVALERQAVGLSDNGNGEADKPPVAPSAEINNDVARRIAFILTQAGRKTP